MNNKSHRVLIIGTGFGGVGLAIKLKQAGIDDFILLEKASGVGGTWRENSYPGAACDVPSHLYSFSFEPKLDWSRKFAPQAQILGYLQHCVAKYKLTESIRFNAEVVSAAFDATAGEWRVNLADGEQLSATVLVSACGQLSRPMYPKLAGIDAFKGPAFHSACWRHDLDLHGKRVGVIGTGASAIQFVPRIQPQVEHLTLFQRSAAYVISKPDRLYRAWELGLVKQMPWLQKIDRGLKYIHHEARGLAFISMPSLMKPMRYRFVQNLNKAIRDPAKRAALTPDYPMGCKRVLISNDYYPALAQDNVTLVNQAISHVSERGIVTQDGQEHVCDVLIYGTGFKTSEFLAPMQITGLDGVSLNQAWQEGAQAYKGISVSGFPNFFMLYGPNTNLGHNSIIYMLESQYRYVLSAIKQLQSKQLRYVNLKPAVETNYNSGVQRAIKHTVWDQGCTSWYISAAGKHTNNWPGYTFSYRQLTRKMELTDYECVR
ncbi:MAG: NAD(P)/FAD-dependent oxidoreductase [Pseudomonas marincola]|jgi:cation diffusion facilitator CzcD-associated flavoprotein CzcO|uniref:flavin-containing monooxygenase n=1 Tax=Pseudomonas marincola TaxID=437900 RepID=UPI003001F63D